MLKAAKYIFGGAVLLVLIMALAIMALRGCLSKYDERAALAPVLYFDKASGPIIFSLVKYSKVNSYSQEAGSTQKSVTDEYYLQSNDAVTGEKIASKKIKVPDIPMQFPREAVGATDSIAWIFVNELMAFNAFTFQPFARITDIENKNPFLKGKLPAERRYYQFNKENKCISITANDGSYWSLNTATLIASPDIAEVTDPVKFAEKAMDAMKQNLYRFNVGFNEMKLNQDTLNGQWFGLYSATEMDKIDEAVKYSMAYAVDERRRFVRSNYTETGMGLKLDKKAAKVIAEDRYFLDGGFLMDKHTAKLIRLTGAAGCLVVYKAMIGNNGNIIVCKMLPDGSMAWNVDTALPRWVDWEMRGKRLYIFGSNRKTLSNPQCSLLQIIDTETGSVKRYDYFEDKILPGQL